MDANQVQELVDAGVISQEDAEIHLAISNKVILGPNEQGRMYLLPDEQAWAQEIKDFVENTPELDNLSDFWYAQFALVDKGDLEASIRRVHMMQELKQEYKIVDSINTAKRAINEFLDLFPRWFFTFGYNIDKGGCIIGDCSL